ncbi:Isocitrate lyase 1 [Vanrija pseudolonga]|uniref:methylisocitrate lyase n=1 Tax=Vanrija pseudolonga TaxID=143232 RepID=A0AAF0Y1M5_9TREE|nr:Isocitrate lyase 1 [Vanrija pseudolonga]
MTIDAASPAKPAPAQPALTPRPSILNHRNPATIEAFFASPTQRHIRRPYTAQQVAELRDVLPPTQSNAMPLRLREILEAHKQQRTGATVVGVADAVTLDGVTKAGAQIAYVSGAALSFADSAAPGADLSDYTYDTVAKKVETLVRSQLLHGRLYRRLALRPEFEGRGFVDPLIPLIADADSGFGLHSTVMKATKQLVEAGGSGFHIDDLVSGSKRFDHSGGVGAVVVPFSEYARRLSASKLQLDILASEAVLIARTDTIDATHITSTIDGADTPYILGATIPQVESYACATLNGTPGAGETWVKNARLRTLREAFDELADEAARGKFAEQSKGLNVADAKRVADVLLGKLGPLAWDPESPRTYQGWYRYRGSLDAAIDRATRAAPLADVLWYCTFGYTLANAARFADEVLGAHPDKYLMFNTSQTRREWLEQSDEELAKLPQRIGALGYVLTILPLAGQISAALGAVRGARAVLDGGVRGLFDGVITPYGAESAGGPLVSDWYGHMGTLADYAMDVIGDGVGVGVAAPSTAASTASTATIATPSTSQFASRPSIATTVGAAGRWQPGPVGYKKWKNIVVIGASVAGHSFVNALANNLPMSHRIILIERNEFVQHAPIVVRALVVPGWESKNFTAPVTQETMFPANSRHRVLCPNAVVALKRNHVWLEREFEGEMEIEFERCIIATGAQSPAPIRPAPGASMGEWMAGLRKTQHDIKHAESVLIEINETYPRKKVTIVHWDVGLLHPSDSGGNTKHTYVPPKTSSKLSTALQKQLADRGVDIILCDRVDFKSGSWGGTPGLLERMHAIPLVSGKTIDADYVFNSTGNKPNARLVAEGDPDALTTNGYISVDEFFRVRGSPRSPLTGAYYAIGDCANSPSWKTGVAAAAEGVALAGIIDALIRGNKPKPYTPSRGMRDSTVLLGSKGGAAVLRIPWIGSIRAPDFIVEGKSQDFWAGKNFFARFHGTRRVAAFS